MKDCENQSQFVITEIRDVSNFVVNVLSSEDAKEVIPSDASRINDILISLINGNDD